MTDKLAALTRMPSNIPGLDSILDGGFLKGGVYLVWGEPGVGKTIFGNQLCYGHVRAGGRALYLTLLAESHVHMMQHMSSLSFFNPDAVPNSLSYVSGYSTLTSGDLKEVLKLISREINARKATLLVIDGLGIVTSSYPPTKMKEFVHELQTVTQAYGCTTFLLTDGAQNNYHPENTMVDGLIALHRTIHGNRSYREIEVLKLRGSRAIFGRHTFKISSEGLVVYPRTESILGKLPYEGPGELQRISTGAAAVDAMLGGGLPRNTMTMLLGPSGVGKTTFGLHFACGAAQDDPGLIFSFYETPSRLISKAARLNLDLRSLVGKRFVDIIWASPPEQLLDDLAEKLLTAVKDRKVKRLFIDGIDGFSPSTPYPERLLPFLTSLENELRQLGVTSVYTAEMKVIVGPTVEAPISGVSLIADNLILFRYVEHQAKLLRLMSILKVRDSNFDHALREYRISAKGLELVESAGSAEVKWSDNTSSDGGHSSDDG